MRKPNGSVGGFMKTGWLPSGPSASTSHGKNQGGGWRGGFDPDGEISASRHKAGEKGALQSGFPANFGIKGSGGAGRPSKGPKSKKMY